MSALQCLRRTTLNLRAVLPAARTYSSNPPAAIPNPEPSLTAPLTPGPIKPGSEAEVVRSGTLVGTKLTNINYLKNKADPVALEDSQYPEWLWAALESSKASSAGPSEDVGDLYSKSKKSRTIAKKRAARLAALAALDPEVKVPIEEQTIDLPFATVSNAAYGPATRAAITRTVAAVGGIGSEITEKVTGKGQKLSVKATTVEIGRDAAVQVTTMDAANARIEVKKAMRKKGRSKIKEGNFLAQM